LSHDTRRWLGRFALLLALVAAGLYLVTDRLVLPWTVQGPSMVPTLNDGDRVLVDLWSYRHRAPRRGELVLFAVPEPRGGMRIKRVGSPAFGQDPLPGSVWVEGDNRSRSVDSRAYGAIPRCAVRGRIFFVYWPPSRVGPIR
jgi:type IV secretory pathway protease TraF